MSKNRYEYKINGNNYVLRTNREKSETDLIVKYVDNKINDAKKSLNYKNQVMHATLACLNIADDLFDKTKSYESLKKDAEEPLQNYAPLKEKFDLYKESHKEIDKKIQDLEIKVLEYEKQIENLTNSRDKFKLELDRQLKLSEKNIEENKRLMNELLKQEKLTLQAKKQIQELLK